MARLTGDIPKDEKLTVGRVAGIRRQPGTIHAWFKKKEFIYYNEVSLMDRELSGPLATFASPLKIMQKFGTSGADGLAVSYRKPDSAAPDGTETLFALQVAKFRDGLDPKRQAMLDVVWRPGSRHVVVAVAGTRPFVGRGGGEGSGAGAAGDNVKGLHPVSAD